MERDIDMGQTIEEAARIERERIILELHADYKIHGDARHYVISSTVIGKYGVNLFKAGAEWQAKQFPWISTKDKLPDDEDLVITGCWCTDYFKYLQQGWYCRECNEWYDTNGDKICVTHWMPILDLRNSINRAFKGGS